LNLDAISANIDALMGPVFGFSEEVRIEIPTLFVKGEKSPYITQQHFELIEGIFTDNQIVTIPNAGHWVHAEQPNQFLEVVNGFLQNGN
jgi:pimeloyl-ACP methyl ester carboxylesterase